MSASFSIRLAEIEEQIDGVASQLKQDAAASQVLHAVFDELHRKTREARDELKGADESTIRDHLIEVEQAADSAKRAAEAEENLAPSTRDAVFEIHEELSALKDDLGD